jgi:hypothetical protein
MERREEEGERERERVGQTDSHTNIQSKVVHYRIEALYIKNAPCDVKKLRSPVFHCQIPMRGE